VHKSSIFTAAILGRKEAILLRSSLFERRVCLKKRLVVRQDGTLNVRRHIGTSGGNILEATTLS
jgi:hypothetical protein